MTEEPISASISGMDVLELYTVVVVPSNMVKPDLGIVFISGDIYTVVKQEIAGPNTRLTLSSSQ